MTVLRIDNQLGMTVINIDLLRPDLLQDIISEHLVDHSILAFRGSDDLSTRWLLSISLLGSTIENPAMEETLVPPLLSIRRQHGNSAVSSANQRHVAPDHVAAVEAELEPAS